MNIAIVNVTASFVSGGAETYTWNSADYLKQRHTVTVFAGNVDNPQCRENVQVELIKFVGRKRWPNWGSRFRKLMERLSFAWNARKILKTRTFDIVMIHKPYDIFLAFWMRRMCGAKIVWRCHGTDFFPGLGKLLPKIDGIFCVSDYARKTLVAKYSDLTPRVIHTGVDVTFWNSEKLTPQHPFDVLYFGRLVGWKGVAVLVRALSSLRLRPGAVKIVGSGPQAGEIQRLIESLDLTAEVSLQPALTDREHLRQLIHDAQTVVFPSFEDETFSNAILEAMSMTKAIVATAVGGNVEALSDEENAVLVPARDSTELARAIDRVLDDGILRARIAQAARRSVEANFSAQKCFENMESYLNEVRSR